MKEQGSTSGNLFSLIVLYCLSFFVYSDCNWLEACLNHFKINLSLASYLCLKMKTKIISNKQNEALSWLIAIAFVSWLFLLICKTVFNIHFIPGVPIGSVIDPMEVVLRLQHMG